MTQRWFLAERLAEMAEPFGLSGPGVPATLEDGTTGRLWERADAPVGLAVLGLSAVAVTVGGGPAQMPALAPPEGEAREVLRAQLAIGASLAAAGHRIGPLQRKAILRRAIARVQGGGGAEGVEVDAREVTYAGFATLERLTLRHRRFDGGITGPRALEVFQTGDAVVVLPWDPATDRVLLIEEFRPGPFARGDAAPWQTETVAGLCDAVESLEDTARREAREEAGVDLGRLERLLAFYPSPGATTEFVTAFVGEARLDGAGGLFGLAAEGEDIRAFTTTVGEALAAADRGEIRNAPLLLTLYAFARRHGALRAAWG